MPHTEFNNGCYVVKSNNILCCFLFHILLRNVPVFFLWISFIVIILYAIRYFILVVRWFYLSLTTYVYVSLKFFIFLYYSLKILPTLCKLIFHFVLSSALVFFPIPLKCFQIYLRLFFSSSFLRYLISFYFLKSSSIFI